MKKLIIIAAVISLTGCATIQRGADTAGRYLCEHKETIRLALMTTMANAALISDPITRDLIMAGAQAQLNTLSFCPATPAAPGEIINP